MILRACLVVLALAGCSQVAQLQPVAGDAISAVRIATMDVLSENDVPVAQWPTCTSVGNQYTCTGTTADGQEIRSTALEVAPYGATVDKYGAPEDADVDLTVTVGPKTLYRGKVAQVLSKAGRVQR